MKGLVAGFDIETTGLEPGDHRIVEIYVGLWRLETRALVFELNQRLNPERTIPPETTRIHGITLADVADKPIWKEMAPAVSKILAKADLHVAHNGREFDRPFVDHELKRVGIDPVERPMVDTMLEGRWATPNGSIPSLAALCFACDVPYDPSKAHAADYDVRVMMDCFFAGLDWGFFKIEQEGLTVAEAA